MTIIMIVALRTHPHIQKYGLGSTGTAIGVPYQFNQVSLIIPDECRSYKKMFK